MKDYLVFSINLIDNKDCQDLIGSYGFKFDEYSNNANTYIIFDILSNVITIPCGFKPESDDIVYRIYSYVYLKTILALCKHQMDTQVLRTNKSPYLFHIINNSDVMYDKRDNGSEFLRYISHLEKDCGLVRANIYDVITRFKNSVDDIYKLIPFDLEVYKSMICCGLTFNNNHSSYMPIELIRSNYHAPDDAPDETSSVFLSIELSSDLSYKHHILIRHNDGQQFNDKSSAYDIMIVVNKKTYNRKKLNEEKV